MVQVSYPGVYVQEVSSGVHTITGVSTSIAAFFGRTTNGPINRAVRVLSMADFYRNFEGSHPDSRLAQSVKQFFDNGGTDCYIVRIAPGAAKAAVTMKSEANVQVLRLIAKNEGAWGNNLFATIDYGTPDPERTFNLTIRQIKDDTEVASEKFASLSMNPNSPRYAPDYVTQNSGLIDATCPINWTTASITAEGYSQSRRPLPANPAALVGMLNDLLITNNCCKLNISLNGKPFVVVDLGKTRYPAGLTVLNASLDTIKAELRDRIKTQLQSIIPDADITVDWVAFGANNKLLKISSNTSGHNPKTSVRVRRAPDSDLAGPLMLGVEQGGIEADFYSGYRPAATATCFVLDEANIDDFAQLDPVKITRVDQLQPGTATVLKTVPLSLVTAAAGQPVYVDKLPSEVNGHSDGVREKLLLIARTINDTPDLLFRAEVWGYRLAFIPRDHSVNTMLEMRIAEDVAPATPPVQGYVARFVQNLNEYVLGGLSHGGYQEPTPAADTGSDGSGTLDTADIIGKQENQTGFHALDSVDIFNLLIIPPDGALGDPQYEQLYGEASNYCAGKRAFLIMDAPGTWTKDGRPCADSNMINSFRNKMVKDYSAVYYPKLQYAEEGKIKPMGVAGAIAGLMARTDSTRGVWKAPAGIDADIRGILGLDVKLTDLENGVYNKLGVNCLRVFPDGYVSWGARTMAGFDDNSDTEWKYIPIRRLALYLEESLYRGTKWVVFEPNDEPLWARIRLNINAFMMSMFRQGAFQGSTPDKAYYVKCDAETTTQDDRNKGIVNIEVGFAPLKPAEFVVIKIQQIAGEL